jgi:hypothetical protein
MQQCCDHLAVLKIGQAETVTHPSLNVFLLSPCGWVSTQVIIVDEFTGRTMPGRRWSDGLHQAVEAKEALDINAESITLASVSYQAFFRWDDHCVGIISQGVCQHSLAIPSLRQVG